MTAPTLTEFLLARIAEDETASHRSAFMHVHGPHMAYKVRADVEAKRRIVELHQIHTRTESTRPQCARCRSMDQREPQNTWPCETVRALAAVYSDHPDYDEAWRA